MKVNNEDNIQKEVFTWYNNNHCLKNHINRGLIFSIPNGGTRNIREAMTFKSTGLLKGASDLVVIFPNGKLCFIELKTEKGVQSAEQKDFEARITKAGYEYHLIRSLPEFINLTNFNKC
jgi:hypothetical protein